MSRRNLKLEVSDITGNNNRAHSALRKIGQRLIYRLCAQTEKGILERVKTKAIVSFDVFDTAVKRDVAEPKDVFTLIEARLKSEANPCVEHFYELRVEAERAARKANHGHEVTLEKIYSHLPVSNKQRHELMRLECQVEIEISRPNIPIKHVYDACVRQGKKVLFISDMYLSSNVIYQILQKNGYDASHLYVSCEVGRTKRESELFKYVQEVERLEVSNWIHMGDAIPGDFLVPKRLGIKTLLIDRNPRYK